MTDPIEFETERALPPMIFDVPSPVAKIGSIIWIDKSARMMVSLPVKVRDENIQDKLQAHWRIVSKDDPTPMFTSQDIRVTGEILRDLKIDVQTGLLRDGLCARLDLAVSGSFFANTDPRYFDATRGDDDSDIDYAFWGIWEGEGQARTSALDLARLAASCPTNEKLLTPITPDAMGMGDTP